MVYRDITVNCSVTPELCTGCGACENICPVSAIEMGTDPDGFLYPTVNEAICINCGKCMTACPVLSYKNDNSKTPRIYAARAIDSIRVASSSGGVFTVLAEKILSWGGVICGAAFDSDMILHHIIVKTKNDLPRLKGSKYLQSNVHKIYKEIKEILEQGKPVLFTGTPCQNAALKNYLSKPYEQLYLVDVLCHGVPSQNVFSQYLREIANGKKVKAVYFRDKIFGWQAVKNLIEFTDGSVYTGDVQSDAYQAGFHKNLFLRKACAECNFSDYPREGDISIGDFWGITDIDASQNDGKGTSIVFINNKKGEALFYSVIDELYEAKEYDFTEIGATLKNRIHAYYPANVKRQNFFTCLQNGNSIYDAVKKTIPKTFSGLYKEYIPSKNKFDIGLVSNFYAGNFGGSLTQLALYNVLKHLGYTVGMIECPLSSDSHADRKTISNIYLQVPYDEHDIIPRYKDRDDMEKLNDICTQFVVGSDQLFQYSLYKKFDKFTSLSWVKDTKKKIAYAASFGHGEIWGNIDDIAEMGYFLNKFDAFSVREKDALQICEKHFDLRAEWVLDPVFLCDKNLYYDLARKASRKKTEPYIASYILDPSEDNQKIIKTVMDELNLPVEIYSELGYSEAYIKPLGDLNVIQLKMEERLSSIANCDYFVTDSFHGTCFAIIFGKPFISILNTKRGASRFSSLLEMFKLEKRLIKNSTDLIQNKDIITEYINWDLVNEILQQESSRSLLWLKTMLAAPKKNIYSDYDMMKSLIRKQQEEIDLLHQEIVSLARTIKKEGRYIENIYEYLDYLEGIKKNYIICISAKDTLGLALNTRIAEKLNTIGVQYNLAGKHGKSYVALLDCGKNVFEKIGVDIEPIDVLLEVSGMNIHLVSRVYKNGNEAKIEYNGIDYAVNSRGINIVLISSETGLVEDSVCFDTHTMPYNCYRK